MAIHNPNPKNSFLLRSLLNACNGYQVMTLYYLKEVSFLIERTGWSGSVMKNPESLRILDPSPSALDDITSKI